MQVASKVTLLGTLNLSEMIIQLHTLIPLLDVGINVRLISCPANDVKRSSL
jgi:hypothetical protein